MAGFADVYKEWLNDLADPFGAQANFASRIASGLPTRQRGYLLSLFGQEKAGYLGELGKTAATGENPTLTWDEYLNRYFRPRNELMQAPLEQSGRGTARVAGPLRVLWNL